MSAQAGAAQAAWGNVALAERQQAFQQQQRQFAAQQQQQEVENRMRMQQMQSQAEDAQRQEAYRQQQLQAQKDYKDAQIGLGYQRDLTSQGNAQLRSDTQMQLGQMKSDDGLLKLSQQNDQFLMNMGLKRDQLETTHSDRVANLGSKIQSVAIQQVRADQAYSLALQKAQTAVEVRQATAAYRQVVEAGKTARSNSRLTGEPIDQTAAPAPSASVPAGVGSGGGAVQGVPATLNTPFKPAAAGPPAPATQPAAPAPATPFDKDLNAAMATSKQPSVTGKYIDALNSLESKGYKATPDGTTLPVARHNAQKLLPIESRISQKKPLDDQHLIDLTTVMMSDGTPGPQALAKAAAFLRANGYDADGKPIGKQPSSAPATGFRSEQRMVPYNQDAPASAQLSQGRAIWKNGQVAPEGSTYTNADGSIATVVNGIWITKPAGRKQ